jgi:hypothetical protein
MTVKELIAELQLMPKSMTVVIGDGTQIESAQVENYNKICDYHDEENDIKVVLLT